MPTPTNQVNAEGGSTNLSAKLRLRYLLKRYFPEVNESSLVRRLNGSTLPDEHVRDKNPRPSIPVGLKKALEVGAADRTIKTWFALPGESGYSDGKFIHPKSLQALSYVLANYFGLLRTLSAADCEKTQRDIYAYLTRGSVNPTEIFEKASFIGRELTIEHTLPFVASSDARRQPQSFVDQRLLAKSYLQGQLVEDWGLLRVLPIERRTEQEIVERLQQGSRFLVLTGAAGDGKTTILRRTALKLKEIGWAVFVSNAPSPHRQFPSISIPTGRTCVLVDQADLAKGYPFLDRDLENNNELHVVLCARDYQWRRKSFSFPSRPPAMIHLDRIDVRDSKNLARCITDYAAADYEISETALAERLLSSAHEGEHPHLLAAMMSVTKGIGFREIIIDMINQFTSNGDDWTLRYVACGSFLTSITASHGIVPHNIFAKLIARQLLKAEARVVSRQTVIRKIEDVSSEIIPIRTSRDRGATYYDLRHPDIVTMVLARFYRMTWGLDVGLPEELMNDLLEIVAAGNEAVIESKKGDHLPSRSYPIEVANALVTADAIQYRWLPRQIGASAMELAIGAYGNLEGDKATRGKLLSDWARSEAAVAPDFALRTDDGGFLFDQLFERATSCPFKFYSDPWPMWAKAKARLGAIGSWPNPDLYTARWIFLRGWEEKVRHDVFIISWASYELSWEGSAGQLDSAGNPFPKYSARWVYHTAWDEGVRTQNLIIHMAALEISLGHFGPEIEDIASRSRSARWIFQCAWNEGHRDPALLVSWAGFESERGNIGTRKDDQTPEPRYSARWIFQTTWEDGQRDDNFVAQWIIAERLHDNVGSETPEKYSARWICREAWENGIRGQNFFTEWFKTELASMMPASDATVQYSVSWVRNAAVQAGLHEPNFLVQLDALEKVSRERVGEISES